MEFGMSCLFQILNTRPGSDMNPKNYGYFIGILIIDSNRPESKPKISKYLLGLNI